MSLFSCHPFPRLLKESVSASYVEIKNGRRAWFRSPDTSGVHVNAAFTFFYSNSSTRKTCNLIPCEREKEIGIVIFVHFTLAVHFTKGTQVMSLKFDMAYNRDLIRLTFMNLIVRWVFNATL